MGIENRPSEERREVQPRTLVTILSQNLWYRAKADEVRNYLKYIHAHLQPDVVFFTELTTDSPYNPNTNIPGMVKEEFGVDDNREIYVEDRAFRPIFHPLSRHHEGVGTYSLHYPIATASEITLSYGGRAPFQGKNSKRVAVETTIALPHGKTLTVLGVHGSYATPFNKEIIYREDLRLRELVQGRENLVLVGDLNAPPESDRVQGLNMVMNADFDDWSRSTFGRKHSGKANRFHPRVDYAFVANGVAVDSFRLIPPGPSNHAGLLLTVVV